MKEELAGLTPDQLRAREIKEEGNEFYKKKELDKAFLKYSEASALDPNNLVYYGYALATLMRSY